MAQIKKVRITKEVNGAIPANPVVFEMCFNAYDLKESSKTNEISCLTAKTKSKVSTGTETSGGMTMIATEQNMGVIIPMLFSNGTAESDVSGSAWAAGTIYQVGDVVNHSDGEHSLTAIRVKGDAKSGVTEPTITVVGSESQTLTDNNVTWHATPKLVKRTFTYDGNGDTFALEYDIDDGTGIFTKRSTGVEASRLPISIGGDGGEISFQTDLKNSGSITSLDAGWTTTLDGIAGAKLVQMAKDYYSGDPKYHVAKIEDIGVCLDKLDVNIDKGLSDKTCTGGTKTVKRDSKIDGNFTKDFLAADYAAYQAQGSFRLDVELSSGSGAYTKFTFPKVVPMPTDSTFETDGSALLEPEISIEEDASGTSVQVEVAYPQFIATDGTVVQW